MQQMITILGPTASGKTQLAVALAAHLIQRGQPAEIISADSRQVYRRMDIGTGKDIEEYTITNHQDSITVPHHLIDICEPGTKYNLFQYQQDFARAYNNIIERGALPILCGGTGLYIEAVLKGYQLAPVSENKELRASLEGKSLEELTEILRELKTRNGSTMHNTTDVDTAQRAIRAIEIEEAAPSHLPPLGEASPLTTHHSLLTTIIGVHIDRELRREKITRRLKQRLENGMVEEIRGLIDSGIDPEDLIYYGLEYKFVTEYVIGRTTYDEMFRRLEMTPHCRWRRRWGRYWIFGEITK